MDLWTAMQERHSVRNYRDEPIAAELRAQLAEEIDACNRESGLHIQAVFDEPRAFDGFMAHYGKFSGVKNYIALIGKKGEEEKIGYFGERLVLSAQRLGLNTCWVAMTYKKIKTAYTVAKGEKLYCVLSLGYGVTQGTAHKSKTVEEVSVADNPPAWFTDGVRAALLAPTAMNQQKFVFTYTRDGVVSAKTGLGFYAKIDLGIAKYHFEAGADKARFTWAD